MNAIQKYEEFVDEPGETNYSRLDAIGEEAYQVMCLTRREERQRKRLDEILIEIGISIEDYNLIKSGSWKIKFTEYKIRFIQAVIKEHYTYS